MTRSALFGLLPLLVPFMVLVVVLRLRRRPAGPLPQLYPAVAPAPGARMTRERAVFGSGPRLTRVRVGVDGAYLHVSPLPAIGGRAGFSVPLTEVTARADRFPPMILAPDVVRLSFARDPGLPMLIWPHVFARLSAESRGRLAAAPPGLEPGSADAAPRGRG